MKHKKTWIIFLLVSIPLIIVIVGGIIAFKTCVGYMGTNPEKMLSYLEDRYSFSFPSNITNVRAAKGNRTLDGSVHFILKFDMPKKNLETFIYEIGDVHRYTDYEEEDDWRLGSHAIFAPSWFVTTVSKGKIIYVHVSPKNSATTVLKICADTSPEERCIVYMEGLYKFLGN